MFTGSKRYVIIYTGLFEHGVLITSWTNWSTSTKDVPVESWNDAMQRATKFRFLFYAKIWRKMLQKISDDNGQLRTWKIVPI